MGIRTGKPRGRPKGSKGRHARERAELLKRAAEVIEDVLPDAFKGDAHAYLMTVYKDVTLPLKDRMTAAIGALPYEKPKLATIEHKGNEESPLEIVNRIQLVGPTVVHGSG